jgi:hypothetical protein
MDAVTIIHVVLFITATWIILLLWFFPKWKDTDELH